MEKPIFVTSPSELSLTESTQYPTLASPHPPTAKKGFFRNFLDVPILHRRSRSADGRNPGQLRSPPPAYDTLSVTSSTLQRSKSSASYQSKYSSPIWLARPMRQETMENALELLRKYDTIILMDDSGSMSCRVPSSGKTRWQEAGDALASLAETAQQYDSDGIDIYFLNSKHVAHNMTSALSVREVFDKVKPTGPTPTGERLEQLLNPYLSKLEMAQIQTDGTPIDKKTGEQIKRVNYIVITDGEASDHPKYPIIAAARRLKAMRNLCSIQLGIQFVQIGNDSSATRALKELDDGLQNYYKKDDPLPDIVDTTPYSRLHPVTADGLIKVLLGGINRRIDEQK